MIPTILLVPPTVFLAGALIAVASQRLLRAPGGAELDRAGLLGSAYGLWYGLVHAYYFFVYPDWTLAYLQDGGQIYKPVAYVIYVFVLAAIGASGALAVGWFLHRNRRNLGLTLGSVGFVGVISMLGLAWVQYGRLGTYEEFLGGTARPVGDVQSFQHAATICGCLLAIPFVALIGWCYLRGRSSIPAAAPSNGQRPA